MKSNRFFQKGLAVGAMVALLAGCGNSHEADYQVAFVKVGLALPLRAVADKSVVVSFNVTANRKLAHAIQLTGVTIPTQGRVRVHWVAPMHGMACRSKQGKWARLKPGQSCRQRVKLMGAVGAKVLDPWTLRTRSSDVVFYSTSANGALKSHSAMQPLKHDTVRHTVFVKPAKAGKKGHKLHYVL